ncbi:MAG: polyprenyl synthetase family protein [Candidatus Nanopelagicales bacterium]
MSSEPFSLERLDPTLAERISRDLIAVEEKLLASATTTDPFISEVASHLAQAGGKRLRPMLCLIAGEVGKPTDELVDAAVVVEITHLATLYHDDVMDEAEKRRGAESVNKRWNNTLAILTGDFLFAKASQILASLGPEAVLLQAETFERLVSGQIHETVGPDDDDDSIHHYLQVLSDKTGSLIATSARFGGMFSGLPAPALNALSAYGEALGVAFQIADDILDIASESEDSGKTPGTDLKEGILTLPMLFVLDAKRIEDETLIELLGKPLTDDETELALSFLRQHSAMRQARDEAEKYLYIAKQQVVKLHQLSLEYASFFGVNAQTALDALELIADSVLDRRV